METLVRDIRHAFRLLLGNPAFSIAAILTLGLGIGVNTAVFSVVYGVLVRPLPYAAPDRLVRLSEHHQGATSTLRDPALSNRTFDAWRTTASALEGLAAYSERAYTLTGLGDTDRIRATAVSPELFRLLRVEPAAGDFFGADHALQGSDTVVVLSHQFWQERFSGRADAIGQSITLDGRRYTVLGVTAQGFSFPDRGRALYTPYVFPTVDRTPVTERTQVRVVLAIGRLASQSTLAQAEQEGTTIARSLGSRPISANLLFGEGGPVTVRARSLADEITKPVRPMLLLLAIGVALILLISCANVANLVLARGVARQKEFAIRAALGAGRGRVVRQLLSESIALSLAAGGFGIFIAWAIVRAVPAIAPAGFPRLDDVRLDGAMLVAAVILSFGSGALAALLPALQSAVSNLVPELRDAGGASAGTRINRWHRVLVVTETALAVVLVVGASLLARSLAELLKTDTGYDASNVFMARVTLQGSRDVAVRWQQLATSLVERLEVVPGIEKVGASNMAPLGDTNHVVGFRLPSDTPDPPVIARALGYVVTPGYTDALRIRLIAGRLLSAADVGAGTQPILVNEEFARQYFHGTRPAVGRQYAGILAPNLVSEVVGVVGNVLKDGLDRRPQPEFYVILGHQGLVTMGRQINLLIRTSGDTAHLSALLRQAVRELDPAAAVHNLSTLVSQRSSSVGQPRFVTVVLLSFAVLSLLLAATGLYGVLSYTTSRRSRELAIRAAMGADRASLFGLVIHDGMRVTAIGLLAGIALAAAGARIMGSLLFNVTPLDPIAFAIVAPILAAVAFAACFVPARRAARVDLSGSLRAE